MDIFSLYKTVKFNNTDGVYNLFEPIIIFKNDATQEYTVTNSDEMRIDLIFQNMYNITPNSIYEMLEDIDIILRLNNIDNPLNIKEGMVLKFPTMGQFETYRYSEILEETNNEVIKQLGVKNNPNKTTRVDPNRQNYIENDYSLSPVVLDTPREPVRIVDGRFSIGGL
jgi:hypothetical protein